MRTGEKHVFPATGIPFPELRKAEDRIEFEFEPVWRWHHSDLRSHGDFHGKGREGERRTMMGCHKWSRERGLFGPKRLGI